RRAGGGPLLEEPLVLRVGVALRAAELGPVEAGGFRVGLAGLQRESERAPAGRGDDQHERANDGRMSHDPVSLKRPPIIPTLPAAVCIPPDERRKFSGTHFIIYNSYVILWTARKVLR